MKIAQDLPRALKETYISKRFSSLRFISFMGRKENYKTNTVQFSCSVMSNSLEPHGLQHASLPCPSPTPGLIQTHVPRVSDAIQPSHPLSSLSPPVFNLSQHQGLFQWVSSLKLQSTGVSALASVLPMNIPDRFPLGWTGLISLQSKGLSRVFSNTTVKSINSSALTLLYHPTLTSMHDYWKNHSLD